MSRFSIATFNVNSICARIANVTSWLDSARPDLVLLQELKCLDEGFPRMEIEERGYAIASFGQKTYNGVAILSKFPIGSVERGLAGDTSDEQARYIEGVVQLPDGAVRVASVYVPNGMEPGSDKFAYKLKFLERLYGHWKDRLGHELAVIGGDFNCALGPLDVVNHTRQDGMVCYHPEERKRLRALLHLGLYDAFRTRHPAEQQFSWWDYRAGAFERNQGLRIDHLLCSARAMDALEECRIDDQPRQQEKPSDHTPVVGIFKLVA